MMSGYFVVVPSKCSACGKKRKLRQVCITPPELVEKTKKSITYSYAEYAWLCLACMKKKKGS